MMKGCLSPTKLDGKWAAVPSEAEEVLVMAFSPSPSSEVRRHPLRPERPPERKVPHSEAGPPQRVSDSTPPAASNGHGRVYAAERWLIRNLLEQIGSPPIRIVLWNGEEIRGCDGPPIAQMAIRDRRTFLKLLLDPEVQFGDAFTDGRIEIEGDLPELLATVFRATSMVGRSAGPGLGKLSQWLHLACSNTLARSKQNATHHYDLGDDFYRLWLDDELLYTCAYFPTPEATLEEAQRAKLDHVCRKVWLRPGETVVEAGCGWGGLALHMARRYGVTVRAYNVSHAQIVYARRRAEAEGLAGRVEFIEDDYRNISGRCDAFMSVGMLEHVGTDHYRELGHVIDRCLAPNGRGLIHSIGRCRPIETDRWIRRRIFPGAQVPTLREMMDVLEPHALSVLDVENLRLHYAKTLEHWLARFEAAEEQVAAMFDRQFVRMWRMYLSGATAGFYSGTLQLFQVLFARPGLNDIPWTRAGLYADR
jgi:cyclopropane-fatty-acyl-phospholipid synthase